MNAISGKVGQSNLMASISHNGKLINVPRMVSLSMRQ
jgi:hypothetical protein